MIVHILEHGLPLCHFTQAVPAEWPEGHRWTGRDEAGDATCLTCKAIAGGEPLGTSVVFKPLEPKFTFEPSDRLRAIAIQLRQRDPIRGPGDDRVAEALEVIASTLEAMALASIRR